VFSFVAFLEWELHEKNLTEFLTFGRSANESSRASSSSKTKVYENEAKIFSFY
jgi:hypothetical protein